MAEGKRHDPTMLEQVALDLLRIIPVEYGWFTDRHEGKPNDEWQIITSGMHKFTAANVRLGLFAKVFCPSARQYSQAYNSACRELGDLDLKTRALSPVYFHDSDKGAVLLFPLGKFPQLVSYPHYYDRIDQGLIEVIILRWGLYPLRWFDKVVLINVDGIIFSTDLINDTGIDIEDYNRQQGLVKS